jgi:hypothetical protein
MSIDWCSEENLRRAWRYVKRDIRDDFISDVINHADIEYNLESVIATLSAQLKTDQYHPAPLLRIDVPKNDHSSRPGTSLPVVDLIVLYAIAQRLAPLLDPYLCDSVYSFRLNPNAERSEQPLFKDRTEERDATTPLETPVGDTTAEGAEDLEIDFPYDWFSNWKRFDVASGEASRAYDHVAVTDITAYFEDISLDILRERLKGHLADEYRELIDRLFRLLEFWDWSPSRDLPHRIGLPQGNDVSSFLSNLYLMDLDREMLEVVNGDAHKYYRYVDDIKVFTSDYDEACKALVELQKSLRALNLNVQTAKTKIEPTESLRDREVEAWLEGMDRDCADRLDNATRFFDQVALHEQVAVNSEALKRWQRPFARSLTLLRDAGDDRAIDVTLSLFLANPAHKLLTKNFSYLRSFVVSRSYCAAIIERLNSTRFTFPFHRALMYRLGAYAREESEEMKSLALSEIQSSHHWYSKASALFCLHTFLLEPSELAVVARVANSVEHSQVIRSAFVVLLQQGGREPESAIDQVSLFSAPRQEYLRRYFLRLFHCDGGEIGRLKLKNASVNAPTFIHNLHKLDLLKGSSNTTHRRAFLDLIETRIRECEGKNWTRMTNRLNQIKDGFISR